LDEYLAWSSEKTPTRASELEALRHADHHQRSFGFVPLIMDILQTLPLLSAEEVDYVYVYKYDDKILHHAPLPWHCRYYSIYLGSTRG
jgi:hypothetical protein